MEYYLEEKNDTMQQSEHDTKASIIVGWKRFVMKINDYFWEEKKYTTPPHRFLNYLLLEE